MQTFITTCPQRGCVSRGVSEIQVLCPVCKNPLLPSATVPEVSEVPADADTAGEQAGTAEAEPGPKTTQSWEDTSEATAIRDIAAQDAENL